MRIESAMTPRLLAIAESVPFGASLCDVGTDHGYIPIYLFKQKKIKKALAMDIRQGPLSRAEENIAHYGFSETIGTRLSDGLQKLLPGEADTAVIAGMGGLLIAEILAAQSFFLDCYILQPMTATAELRMWLKENGYVICAERLAQEEEKLYTVMTVRRGEALEEAPVYNFVGKKLIENRDPLAGALITGLLAKYQAAKEGLSHSKREDAREKEVKFGEIIADLEKLKAEVELW